jgi:hypothetical protein
MPALLGIGCGKFLQSIFPGGLRHGFTDGFVLGKVCGFVGRPRSTTSQRLDWRGVLQKWAANLERLGVRGQILDNKRLTVFFATFVYTAPP